MSSDTSLESTVACKEAPSSLDELARITGRAKSNLSRTLKTMGGYGLVRLERGDKGRITPKVTHDRVELDLPLIGSRERRSKSQSSVTEGPSPRG